MPVRVKKTRQTFKAFSSEVDAGSREENASTLKAFSSEVDTSSRAENASKYCRGFEPETGAKRPRKKSRG
jgi:hypothetical protein